jgi:hypothetical protein
VCIINLSLERYKIIKLKIKDFIDNLINMKKTVKEANEINSRTRNRL